jgi:hypothetical protein
VNETASSGKAAPCQDAAVIADDDISDALAVMIVVRNGDAKATKENYVGEVLLGGSVFFGE